MNPITKLRILDNDPAARNVTLQWPDGATIVVRYPSSVGSPQDYGWNESSTAWAWCFCTNRLPWIFAFDITN